MRGARSVAGMAIATMLVAGLGVAGATSAAAQDDGPALSGNIYFLNNNVAGLANATAADQVTGGTYAGRPFTGMAVDASCPAGTAMVNTWVRLKTAAVEEQWEEVFLTGSQEYKEDANGHAYILPEEGFDNFAVNQIQTFLGGTDGDLPIAFICADALGAPYGYFSTTLHLQATKATTGTWSQLNPVLITTGPAVTATTTTLSATAQGANLALTATVSPAVAGTMTFAEGSTTLGTAAVSNGTASLTVTGPTAGNHSYTATFAPSDTSTYGASDTTQTFTVTQAADGSITVTLTVPEAPLGAPGAVTLTVPTSAAIALAGQRNATNTLVTATGALPTITVTDTHRDDLLTAWQVNVQASDFTTADNATTIGAKYLGLTPTVPATTALDGTATVVQAGSAVPSYNDDASSTGLAQAKTLGQVSTNGRGTTTLGGSLNLSVDGSAAQGTYTSVITVTLIGG